MDLGPLRTLALGLNLSAHGVPATVTRPAPDDTPVVTTGIWITTPLDEQRPVGVDFQRREPRRVMALPRSALASVPRHTIVVASETIGGANKTWRVDGLERTDADVFRVILVAA